MTAPLGVRLTVYYVFSIAVILAGFSVALYAVAAKHLYRQVDERIEAALNTLVAAAEIGPEGVTWEPEERSLSFGRRTFEGRFFWRVADERGKRIDGSATGEIDRILARLGAQAGPTRRFSSFTDLAGVAWRAVSRRLDQPRAESEGTRSAAPMPGAQSALILGAGTSLDGVRTNLRNLALTLAGLSLAVWTLALVSGRRLCRIALRPLTKMADAAHAIGGDEPGRRLPATGTNDELGELGRSFNALLDRLGESLERQQRFAGDASHQLGTPLTALQGQVDLALRQDRSPEEYRRVLTVVRSKTRHLRQIVDGLMFLSRADAEARRPSLERVALDAWLREHIAAWPNARRSDVVYESNGVRACHALVHPLLLGELMNNLLDNAAKYSPPQTPIRVKLEHQNDQVSLSVSDEGPGIDQADLPSIFDPFFRAEAARIRGSNGLGLGLSVAARIAVVFDGQITVSSAPGQGATFSVILPESDSTSHLEPGVHN
jgi:two-component system, OmpR family, sensor kinase